MMKKLLVGLMAVFISGALLAQAMPDADGDGIADPDDVCPFEKGTKAGKGCPEKTEKPPVFISREMLENILTTICTNKLTEKIKGVPENNKTYITSFPFNGVSGNLPVYYKQSGRLNFSALIGLSENSGDTSRVLVYINQLLAGSRACDGVYSGVKLTYNHTGRNYSDVYASPEGGVFFYLEKVKSGNKMLIRLRINKLSYNEQPAKAAVKPIPVILQNDCAAMETILEACISGYSRVKGSFVKEEIPARYYTTTLPALGFSNKYVVESVNIEFINGNMVRKNIVYYNADQEYTGSTDALNVYEKMKASIKKCFSGAATVTDDKNQKIYELITDYKGRKIRVALIYLNFFSSSVSVSVKTLD
jgi:hypothetical protein